MAGGKEKFWKYNGRKEEDTAGIVRGRNGRGLSQDTVTRAGVDFVRLETIPVSYDIRYEIRGNSIYAAPPCCDRAAGPVGGSGIRVHTHVVPDGGSW
jgi:hypothetical protein